MFSTGSGVVSNISRARSMRASASHAIGEAPVSSRNRRLKVRRDMLCPRRERAEVERKFKVFEASNGEASRVDRRSRLGMSLSMNCAWPP